MNTFSLQLYGFASWTGTERLFLLNGPVPECLRLVHGKELPVPKGWNSLLPTWEPQVTIARNCRFPEDGTLGSQPGSIASNCRFPDTLPNLGTTGYHCKELPVPRGWNSLLPTWEPQVTIARNCRFPEDGTLGSQPGNQRLPLQATAGSQRLELSVANVGTTGYHCKELPVPRGWNSWFPTWAPEVTIASSCPFLEVGTHASQPGNHRLPLQGTSGSQRLELLVPNLVTIARNCRFPEVGTLGSQPGNHGLPLQATVKMIWKQVRYNFMVLLNGPVHNAWFCLMDRYRNVCVWFMARNCRFPKVGTLCCQRGNHRLPLQGTAGS